MTAIQSVKNFTGYKNFEDITKTPVTNITAGSRNVFIPDGDKLVPRAGMDYFGASDYPTSALGTQIVWVIPGRIHSKYDDFVNKAGYKIPIRVFNSGNAPVWDIVQAYLPEFNNGVETGTKLWYTFNTPGQGLRSTHRYYFAEWNDKRPISDQAILVFTIGDNDVHYWTGGFAPITAIGPNSLTTNKPWSAYGFNANYPGPQKIVINNAIYHVTSTFDSTTITVTESTGGVSVNDIAFDQTRSKSFTNDPGTLPIVFDVCSAINNQLYYLDFNTRNLYVSWNRNQDASTTITDNAVLADLVASGTYTGRSSQSLTFRIDSVIQQPVRTFVPAVTGNMDDIGFSGVYTGTTRNTYRVVQNGVGPTFFYDIFINGVFITNTALNLPYNAGNGIIIQSTSAFFPTINSDGDTWEYTVGGEDTYSWYIGNAIQGNNIPCSTSQTQDGVTYSFLNSSGHTLGDSFFVSNSQEVSDGYANFTYDAPDRLPGQGYILPLDSNGWTLIPQEQYMYAIDATGKYYTVNLKLAADLKSETITTERLKSEPQNKPLFPYLIKYIKNQLSIISQEKTFDVLGRQKLLELPQLKSISDEVRIDFETADWLDGDILYYKRKFYFCVPRTGLIFIYDDYKKYWHAPMEFGRRISLLSIIDNKLIGHSFEGPESYELFTGLNDLGLYPINTKIVFPYDSFGERFGEKYMSGIGFEGYIHGNPQINWLVNADVGGCSGQHVGIISPQNTQKGLCIPKDTSSLGKSSLGFHGLGNDPVQAIPHFYYIQRFDNLLFYQRNIELTCNSMDQRWELVSVGTDVFNPSINNESITDPESVTG